MVKILMVCLGNICRSPLAEGVLKSKLPQDLFFVDSAGTSNYHINEAPDKRSIAIGKKYGIDISSQRGRQFLVSDFDEFDHIYVMDHSNYDNVTRLARHKDDIDKVNLILEVVDNNIISEVPDPYYGKERGFEHVYQLLDAACNTIAKKLNE